MPVHDWTRVEAGIFHHFHHRWTVALSDALNAGVLPNDYYALAEQFAGGFGPDVLTLQGGPNNGRDAGRPPARSNEGLGLLQVPPKLQVTAETDWEFYERKQKAVTVRHVSGDRVVAMVEIVSPGNKGSNHALRRFVDNAYDLLHQGIHLLIIDLLPPGPRDPQGIHGAIWEEVAGQKYTAPPDKPMTQAAYEAALALRAYVVPFAVGDSLTEMPLFLEPGGHVPVPLETTYQSAFAAVPRRWRTVLEA